MDVPRITYYAKVIDNLTGKDITNYKNAMDNDLWYYGKINSNLGGESQFILSSKNKMWKKINDIS